MTSPPTLPPVTVAWFRVTAPCSLVAPATLPVILLFVTAAIFRVAVPAPAVVAPATLPSTTLASLVASLAVTVPLVEIAPYAYHPGFSKTALELLYILEEKEPKTETEDKE